VGQFFTNVQIFNPELITVGDGKNLVEVIRNLIISQGYKEVSAFDPAVLRRIYISCKAAGNWFTVLDSITEGQDPDLLDQIASALSSASNLTAVSILVHDGDRLQMSLFRDGIKQDSIDSWPGYFNGEKPVVSSAEFIGWADLLPVGKTVASLTEAWELADPAKGALPILQSIGETLGMEDPFYKIGADSFPMTLEPYFVSLQFHKFTQSIPDKTTTSPLPSFDFAGGLESLMQVSINEVKSIELVAHSTGNASTGLNFFVWGSALNDGLVQISHAQVTIGNAENIPAIALPLQEIASTHGRMLSAVLPDVLVPSGFSGPDEAIQQAYGDFENGLSSWLSSRISINFQLLPLAIGKGELHISLQTPANEDAQAYWNTYMHVTAP